MEKTTISITPTTRDKLFRWCKRKHITYDKGISNLIDGIDNEATQESKGNLNNNTNNEKPIQKQVTLPCPYCNKKLFFAELNDAKDDGKEFIKCRYCGGEIDLTGYQKVI